MDKTTPMQPKPLVNATCKLGKKGCFDDGRCHALVNCKNKLTTNADRIRAMSDEELAEWLYTIDHYWDDGESMVNFGGVRMQDSKEDILDWLKEEVD